MVEKIFFPNDDNPQRIKSLDGLRGVAVLIVIVSHGSDLGFDTGIDFRKFGKLGVYLFFILSAFLLDKQIINAFKNKKSSIRFWLNYTLRRFLRIFPLFLISLIFYYQINEHITPTFINSKKFFTDHLIFKKADIFYWSIPPELEYYLLSPILILFLLKVLKLSFKNIIACLIIIIAFLILINNIRPSFLPYFYLFKSLPIFLVGTILAFFWSIEKPSLKVNNFVAYICIAIMILMIPGIWNSFFKYNLPVNSFKMNLPYGILLAFTFINAISSNSVVNKITKMKVLRFLGNISFSLYLFHWAAGLITINFIQWNGALKTIVYFMATIMLSSLIYILIELPLSKIRITNKSFRD